MRRHMPMPRGPQIYLGKGILEEEAVGCQLLDVWGSHQLISITAQGGEQVIHDDKKDVQSIYTRGKGFGEIDCNGTEPSLPQ